MRERERVLHHGLGYWISCAPSDAITRNHHQVPEVTLTGADRRIYVSERKHGKRVDGRPSLSPCYVHIYIYIYVLHFT